MRICRSHKALSGLLLIMAICILSMRTFAHGSMSLSGVKEHSSTLAPQTIFSPITEDSRIKDLALVKYRALYHVKEYPQHLLGKGIRFSEKLSEQSQVTLDFSKKIVFSNNSYLVPVSTNGRGYFVFITSTIREDQPPVFEITSFTQKEVEEEAKKQGKLPKDLFLSHQKRPEEDEINAFIDHEVEIDSLLRNAHDKGQTKAISAADVRVRNVLGFFRALGADTLASDAEKFIIKNCLFVITGHDDIPVAELEHSSQIAIHIKDDTDFRRMEEALVLQLLLKAGAGKSILKNPDMVGMIYTYYADYMDGELIPKRLLDTIYAFSNKEVDLRTQGFIDLNAKRDRLYKLNPEVPEIDKAVGSIRHWKMAHSDDLNDRAEDNPFWTKLQRKAWEIYEVRKIQRLPLKERLAFSLEVFDKENFPNVQHLLSLIMNRMSRYFESSTAALSVADYHRLTDLISRTSAVYSILDNKNIRFALRYLILDTTPQEGRINELRWLIGEIDKELNETGSGRIPMTATMQDLHGGAKRAASLTGFVLGVPPERIVEIQGVEDLKRILNEENINIADKDIRLIGFNDIFDKGNDPIGSFELVAWLKEQGKLKYFEGNHCRWKLMAGLGIDKYFDEIGFDYTGPEHKKHHIASWTKMVREYPGWGDIEIDQINGKRVNDAIDSTNLVLSLYGIPGIPHINIAEKRAEYDKELKEIKKYNLQIRTEDENNLANPDPNYVRREDRPVPDLLAITLEYVEHSIRERNRHIKKINAAYDLDIPSIDIRVLTLDNYLDDPYIIRQTLWLANNSRHFYIDIYANLGLHSMLPFDYDNAKVDIHYKGLSGLPAMELMSEDIKMFFEGMTTIPNSHAFRKRMWDELGEAFTIFNSWYSEITPVAKPAATKKFIEAGGPAWLGDELLGWPIDEFSSRPAKHFLVTGHNEVIKKFSKGKNILPWANVFPETSSGVLLIDGQMGHGYTNQGFILTFGKRDESGEVTGLRLWGFADPKAQKVTELTNRYTHGMTSEQSKFFKELSEGKTFLKWVRSSALKEIIDICGNSIPVAEKNSRINKAARLKRIKEGAESTLKKDSGISAVPDTDLGVVLTQVAKYETETAKRKAQHPIVRGVSVLNTDEWGDTFGAPEDEKTDIISQKLESLHLLGFLDKIPPRIAGRNAPPEYFLNDMLRGLTLEEFSEIVERSEKLKTVSLKDKNVSETMAEILGMMAEKIHFVNMRATAAIPQGEVLYYVIPEELIPADQFTMIETLAQNLERSESNGRIILVKEKDLIETAGKLKAEAKAVVAAVKVDFAQEHAELQETGVKTLLFGDAGEFGSFQQFEGVLAALTSHYYDDIDTFKKIYRLLTGDTLEEGIRLNGVPVIYLPTIENINYEDLRKLNERMSLFIQSA